MRDLGFRLVSPTVPGAAVWRGHDFHSEQDEELALMGCLVTFTSPKYFRKSRSVIVALSISLPSLFALLY